MFFLEFVLALWAHPAPGISLLFHPKCKKKNENKPYTSLHLEIANVQNGTNPSSTRRSSPAALTQGVPKRTKRVHKWRALMRVYDVPFWYLPTFQCAAHSHAKLALVSRYKCTGPGSRSFRAETKSKPSCLPWRGAREKSGILNINTPIFLNSSARTGWTEQTYGEKSWGHRPFWEFFFKKPLFLKQYTQKHACYLVNISMVKCQEIWTTSSWDRLNMVQQKNWDVYVQKSKWRSHLKYFGWQFSQTVKPH